MTMRRLDAVLEIKALDDASGVIEGYGSVFGTLDSYSDIVAPGAFAKSIAARDGAPLPMLWNHDAAEPIGAWEHAEEDERGLRLRGRVLTELQRGREALALIKHRAVRGLSIGYVTGKASVDKATGVRTLQEVDLWEVSVVTFGANPNALIDAPKFSELVAQATERDVERFLRDAGFSSGDAKALVSRCKSLGVEREAPRLRSALEVEAAAKRLSLILNQNL